MGGEGPDISGGVGVLTLVGGEGPATLADERFVEGVLDKHFSSIDQ